MKVSFSLNNDPTSLPKIVWVFYRRGRDSGEDYVPIALGGQEVVSRRTPVISVSSPTPILLRWPGPTPILLRCSDL